jgi:hypothetical protein
VAITVASAQQAPQLKVQLLNVHVSVSGGGVCNSWATTNSLAEAVAGGAEG